MSQRRMQAFSIIIVQMLMVALLSRQAFSANDAHPPPSPRPPPKQSAATVVTTLDELVGTWSGNCTQKAVLNGTVQDGLKLIHYAPPNSSAKCGDKGLDVHYKFTVTYSAEGNYTYSRTDVSGLYRTNYYYYGPAVNSTTGSIVGNVSYQYGQQCLTIQGLAGQPDKVSLLVSVKDGVYTEEAIVDTTTNQVMNTCYGTPKKLFVFPVACALSLYHNFTYRCIATKKSDSKKL